MESASTTPSNLFDSHPFPHQQYSSRYAFGNHSNTNPTISKVRLNSLTNQKRTKRLPPISRYDSPPNPPKTVESIKYFNETEECIESNESDSSYTVDSKLRIKQLERNLEFVKQDCQHILESLHTELHELKLQNRDLKFELVMNGSAINESIVKEQVVMPLIKGSLDPQIAEYIRRLETEIKRLRHVLSETLEMNSELKNQLKNAKKDKQTDNEYNGLLLSSPTTTEFNKTFDLFNKTDQKWTESANTLPRITKTQKLFINK